MNDKFKIGDVITSCHEGFHEITKIEKRYLKESDLRYSVNKGKKIGDEYSSLVHYKKILTKDFKPVKRQESEKSCDILYCKHAREYISEMKDNLEILEMLLE